MLISKLENKGEGGARRNMYPKEQWQALKLVIERLYVKEGQTFTKVAEYLRDHYGLILHKSGFFNYTVLIFRVDNM